MYTQVYFHTIRKVYDIHLQDFLRAWLSEHGVGGRFPTSVDAHLAITDNEVMTAISTAARDKGAPGHDAAFRIMEHDHYQIIYRPVPEDTKINRESAKLVFDALCNEFGSENFRQISRTPRGGGLVFPVRTKENAIISSLEISEVLEEIPGAGFDYVFVEPGVHERAKHWLTGNRTTIIKPNDTEVADGSTKA